MLRSYQIVKLCRAWRCLAFSNSSIFYQKVIPNACPNTFYRSEETFVNGTSANYVEEMYNAWLRDPSLVHHSWDAYFRSNTYVSPPNLAPHQPNTLPLTEYLNSNNEAQLAFQASNQMTNEVVQSDPKIIQEHLALYSIIRNFQTIGHQFANLDPLQMNNPQTDVAFLTKHISDFPFQFDNMEKVYQLPECTSIGGGETSLSLGEILKRLRNAYCGNIGVEYMFINDKEERKWIRDQFETPNIIQFSEEERLVILSRLIKAVGFEAFLAKKYSAEKRFGVEGCEILIPAIKEIIDRSSLCGVKSIIMGMPHRGRLNTLANIFQKPLKQIFCQFAGLTPADSGSGDVKYHLGAYVEHLNQATDKFIKLSLIANPSHLEAVDPVVVGKARSEQFYLGDYGGKKVMPILIHGDAAFCGQGIVFETMQLSALPNYTTHGTIHIIVNNQIGFTTTPNCAKSSPHCTDVARVINAPVFHVNADDPESVIYVCKVASDWRDIFHKDVVIDLIGYRRHGHNETDEPKFTQPLMYKKIDEHKNVLDYYMEKLKDLSICSDNDVKTSMQKYEQRCEESFQVAKNETHCNFSDWLDTPWPGFFDKGDSKKLTPTGVDFDTLVDIGLKFSSPPADNEHFQVHKSLMRILAARKSMVEYHIVDWALAEAMAFGSLLKDGIHVRLSGQDVERGTFSHRHHVLHDQNANEPPYNPLQNLYPNQAAYSISNSSLSEYAVLGFEHGYSMTNPNSLVLWEAQFGDFSNTAQCIIDQFISSGQSKWVRQSGLVMLLPHGMEGMGPEHSSARIERFLQMSSEDPDYLPPKFTDLELKQLEENNWIVANCTTPANYFHILRRQVYLPFRKPLILMTPKSLLRLPQAKSHLNEMCEGTKFERLIPEYGPARDDPLSVKKLIFCSGRVYYDIRKVRDNLKLANDIAIVRIEQVAPFPFDLVKEQTDLYNLADIIWAQEEHKNQGCWCYVHPRFVTTLPHDRHIRYVGRPCGAATATGSKTQHFHELSQFLLDIVSFKNVDGSHDTVGSQLF